MTSVVSWETWAPEAKLRLLAALRRARWDCGRDDCDGEPHAGCLVKHARTAQREPPGEWRVWYIQGGRGAGKTRTGAETIAGWIMESDPLPDGEQSQWAIIAPTYGDARDVCVEGPSGLLTALGSAVSKWNRSTGQLHAANGAIVFCDGADDGALRVQGKNLRGAWGDEVGLWKHGWRVAWEESLRFAVRKDPARIVATGTPKAGHGLVRMLISDPTTVVTRMRTLDNASNLNPLALEELMRLYAGKRLGRQELEAEYLEDVEGALWSRAQLEALRVTEAPRLKRVVVAVDPNVSSAQGSNEAGIIVAGVGFDKIGYVLEDRTTSTGGPRAWAQAAVNAYHESKADRIVAEKNNGGEMVELTIKAVDPTVPVKLVSASRGKRVRAEPVAALYEGDAPVVRHVGPFPELEDQLVTWTPEAESPDRMDALVWALTELELWTPPPKGGIVVPKGRIAGVPNYAVGASRDPWGL